MRGIILILILIITLNTFILQAIFNVDIFGVNFSKEFFINLLPNSVVILIGVLAINLLIEKNKIQNLKKINKSKSDNIEFLLNRFALHLLKYLELASLKEDVVLEDKVMNFDWARKRMVEKTSKIDSIFFTKMMASSDREKFIDEFVKILQKNAESLNAALKEVFPHPNPDAIELTQEINYAAGGLNAVRSVDEMAKKANKEVIEKNGNPLTQEQIDLLTEVAYSIPFARPSKICGIIIKLHTMVKDNILFVRI